MVHFENVISLKEKFRHVGIWVKLYLKHHTTILTGSVVLHIDLMQITQRSNFHSRVIMKCSRYSLEQVYHVHFLLQKIVAI